MKHFIVLALCLTLAHSIEINHNFQQLNQTTTEEIADEETSTQIAPTSLLVVKRPLNTNFTRKFGERVRLECEFDYLDHEKQVNPNDFTLYWVKNYQEMLHSKKGFVHVIRKNLTTILILKNLEEFDTGSYMCIAEYNTPESQHQLNASSETTLIVQQEQQSSQNKRKNQFMNNNRKSKPSNDLPDYLLSDRSSDDDLNDEEDLSDEFPLLNPTIVENYDDKGFCEPYRGSICASVITGNYSIYSTSSQQQDLIEERLKTIVPLLLSNKNNLSKRCSTFAIPSLCLFAFPLCDKISKQPKQICRFDCKQLQQDICKNEYFNVKALFETKLDTNVASSQQNQNFLLDCNQLPPSSDSPQDCVPIVTMTLDKLESKIIELNQKNQLDSIINNPALIQHSTVNTPLSQQNCINSNGVEYRDRESVV